jgi:hypothetical protein
MSRPNSRHNRAVDAAAQHLLSSGALDGWLSTPASTASRTTSRSTVSHPATSSRPPTQHRAPSRSLDPTSSSRDPEKTPSAFAEHSEFHGVREPQEETGAEASSSARTRRPARSTPTRTRTPSVPDISDSAPAYERVSEHPYTGTLPLFYLLNACG